MPDDIGKLLTDAAREATAGNPGFVIAVVPDGHKAGIFARLLEKAFRVRKQDVLELGMTVSDNQIQSLLALRKKIVIVPENILAYRDCKFHAPLGVKEVKIVTALPPEVHVSRRACGSAPFQFVPGGNERGSQSATTSRNKAWWQFWK